MDSYEIQFVFYRDNGYGDIVVINHALDHNVNLVVLPRLETDGYDSEELVALVVQLLFGYTDEVRVSECCHVRLELFWLLIFCLFVRCLTLLHWKGLFLNFYVIRELKLEGFDIHLRKFLDRFIVEL